MKKLSAKIWLCVLGFKLVLVAGCGTRKAKMSRIEAARNTVFDTLTDVGENQIGVVPVRLHLDPSGPPPSPRELKQIGRIRAFSKYSDAELIETIGAMKDPSSRFTAIRCCLKNPFFRDWERGGMRFETRGGRVFAGIRNRRVTKKLARPAPRSNKLEF